MELVHRCSQPGLTRLAEAQQGHLHEAAHLHEQAAQLQDYPRIRLHLCTQPQHQPVAPLPVPPEPCTRLWCSRVPRAQAVTLRTCSSKGTSGLYARPPRQAKGSPTEKCLHVRYQARSPKMKSARHAAHQGLQAGHVGVQEAPAVRKVAQRAQRGQQLLAHVRHAQRVRQVAPATKGIGLVFRVCHAQRNRQVAPATGARHNLSLQAMSLAQRMRLPASAGRSSREPV